MLFTCIVRNRDERWAFSIDLTLEMMYYVEQQRQWVLSNENCTTAEFKIDNNRARFVKRRDLNDMLTFEPDPFCGEDPLDYYEFLMDYGTPNQEYWDDTYSIPKDVCLTISKNYIGFRFVYNTFASGREEYINFETTQMFHEDFFRKL